MLKNKQTDYLINYRLYINYSLIEFRKNFYYNILLTYKIKIQGSLTNRMKLSNHSLHFQNNIEIDKDTIITFQECIFQFAFSMVTLKLNFSDEIL